MNSPWTCRHEKANRSFSLLDDSDCFVGVQTLLSWYAQGKQIHWTSRTFPVVTLSSPFPFFSFSPLASFFSPLRMSILVWKHDWLCNFNRDLFHSVPAVMNTARLTSLDKYDSSAEEFEIVFALSFFVISFFISFILWGEGGRCLT